MPLNTILRYIILAGIYALPFIALIIATSMFFPFITGKNFMFRILVELVFGAWLILAWRDANYRPKFSWILAAAAVFLAVVTLVDLLGDNPFKSFWSNYERMDGLITQLHLFAYFLAAISVLKTEDLWSKFFHISFGVSIFVALYGILQLAGELVINQGGVRVDSTFGNATYLGVYTIFMTFLAAFWYVRKRREEILDASHIFISGFVGFGLFALWAFIRAGNPDISLGVYEKSLLALSVVMLAAFGYAYAKFRNNVWAFSLPYFLVVVLQLVMLYHTTTRGAIYGFVGGALLAAVLTVILGRERKTVRKIAAGTLLTALVVVGGLYFARDSSFIRENNALNRITRVSPDDAESRFLIWNMSYQGFKERPILGWGQGNFGLVFNKYYDPRMYKQEPWFDRAHNIVFDWLIAAGLLGLLSYLAIFIAVLYYLLWCKREGSRAPPHQAASGFVFSPQGKSIMIGLLAAYFFQNLFVFDNVVSYMLFFSVLAFIHSEVVRGRAEMPVSSGADGKKTKQKKHISRVGGQSEMINHVVLSFVLIGTFYGMYALNYAGYSANRTLLQALSPHPEGITRNIELYKKTLAYNSFGITETREQLTQFAVNMAGAELPLETKQEIFDLAEGEMKKQIEAVPNDARYRLFFATLYTAYGFSGQAVGQLQEAAVISPAKQHIYYSLANVYLNLTGEHEKAFEAMRTAYELEPSNAEALRLYLTTAISAKKDDVIAELLGKAEDLGDEKLLINAYAARGEFGKVAELWEERARKEPDNIGHRVSLAASYAQAGNREEAVRVLREAIEKFPEFREQGEQFLRELEAGR